MISRQLEGPQSRPLPRYMGSQRVREISTITSVVLLRLPLRIYIRLLQRTINHSLRGSHARLRASWKALVASGMISNIPFKPGIRSAFSA